MISFKKILSATAILGLVAFSQTAAAATVGVAVDAVGSLTPVGSTAIRPALSSTTPAIKYFIPLGNSSGTYGVTNGGTFGTTPDYGNGGGTLTMILAFNPVSTTRPSRLDFLFEDLDLGGGANDPWYFFENIQLFFGDGTALTPLITDIEQLIPNGVLTGDRATQQLLSLSLGILQESPFFVKANFKSVSPRNGWNTPEYLIATVSAIPLPAAAWLFLSALGGLGILGRRRRTAA